MLNYEEGYFIEENDDPRTWIESSYQEDVEEAKEPSEDYSDYWKAALIVINDWSEYMGKKKLYINATHEETRHKVAHIIDESFGGSLGKLKSRENELSENVNLAVMTFEPICAKYKVAPVSRDWLYHNLKESRDYESIRNKCQNRLENNKKPETLKGLTRKIRKSSK